ncbi:MAG: oligosaccharide flippase family protein [Eubacteriales bacterium]
MEEFADSAGKSALFLTVMGLLSQGLAFLYRVALSRMVGAEIMGLYQLLMPVYSVLVALTAVGVTAATAHLTALFLAKNDKSAVVATLNWATFLFVLCLIPVSIVVLSFSDEISVVLLGDARTQLGILLLLPCTFLTGLENIYKHYFYGSGQVKPPALTEFLEQFVRTLAVLGLLFLFPTYPERQVGLIVLGMVVCEIFSGVTLVILYHRQRKKWKLVKQKLPERLVFQMGGIAVPVGASALLGTLMGAANASLIPRLLVEGGMERSLAMSSFGVLCGMTLPMLGLPTVLLGALNLVLIPRQARSLALGRWGEIRRRTHKALLCVSVTMLPAMGLLAVVGGDVGVLLFSDERVGEYLLPLAIASAFSSYQSTLFAILNGIGKQTVTALLSLFSGGTQLLFTLILVPRWGLEGFVLGLLFLSGFHTLFQGYWVLRLTKTTPALFSWLTAPLLSALLMSLTCNLLYQVMEDSGIGLYLRLPVTVVIAVGLYSLALWVQGGRISDIFKRNYY